MLLIETNNGLIIFAEILKTETLYYIFGQHLLNIWKALNLLFCYYITHSLLTVSGTNNHFLAVSKEGRVFERGSNCHGQLGLQRSSTLFAEFSLL